MQIVITAEANKQYKHLPKTEQIKIKKKLAQLEQEPLAGKILSGELSGYRSIRAWPYRIIYSIDDLNVTIKSILHRQGAYK
jgi:addiction module RelE/StbE family toxin